MTVEEEVRGGLYWGYHCWCPLRNHKLTQIFFFLCAKCHVNHIVRDQSNVGTSGRFEAKQCCFVWNINKYFSCPNQVQTWQNCDSTTKHHNSLVVFEKMTERRWKVSFGDMQTFDPSSRLGMRMCCFSQYLFDFCDKTMLRIFPGFTMTLLYKHTCGALTPATDRGDSSLLLPNISGRFATPTRWECAIKQPTLECFICVLQLPHWGFVFGFLSLFFSLRLGLWKQIFPPKQTQNI